MRPLSASARQVRDDERGMTLVEMLSGISIGLIVTFAAWQGVDAASKLQARTSMRVEATNRGRNGMEAITRVIRAQQCFNSLRPMLWASNTGMEFYASIAPDLTTGGGVQPIERHRLEWKGGATGDIGDGKASAGTSGNITESVWRSYYDNKGKLQWPSKPDSVNIVATGVEPAPDRRAPAQTAPIFRYFKYASTTGSGRVDMNTPVPMTNSSVSSYNPTGLPSSSSTDLNGIVLIEVSYRATPRKTAVAKSAAMNFYNTVSVRIADPTNPAGSPQCL